MTDDITVKYEGKGYKLAVDEETSRPVPTPQEILRFSAEDQIKTIQHAIGIEETGTWNAETNLAFTKWLRVQQAEHMGVRNSDGWWGKNTQAALEGKVDENVFSAVKGLYERKNGNLRNLTWRNKYHNAKWEKIEAEVKAEEQAKTEAQAFSNEELAVAAVPAGGIGLLAKKSAMDPFNQSGRKLIPEVDIRAAVAKDIDDLNMHGKAATAEIPTKAPDMPEARPAVPKDVEMKAAAAETPTKAPDVPKDVEMKAATAEIPTKAPITTEAIRTPNAADDILAEFQMRETHKSIPTRAPEIINPVEAVLPKSSPEVTETFTDAAKAETAIDAAPKPVAPVQAKPVIPVDEAHNMTKATNQASDVVPVKSLSAEAAEAVSKPKPTMITIEQRHASGWGRRILEGLEAAAGESRALKLLGRGGKGLLRALPAVGAGIAAAEVAYAQDDAGLAVNTGLIDEQAQTALWGGYSAHIAQGGFDPTAFGGEVATLGIFSAIEKEYGLDPVMAVMTRPALMADLADELFSDGMPELTDEQAKAMKEKYSDENMRGIYDGIIERNGLPSKIYDEKAGEEIPIEEAVRDYAYMNRLEEVFEDNETALQGLKELQFATAAQDTATQWQEKIEERSLHQELQEQNDPEKPQTVSSQEFKGIMP